MAGPRSKKCLDFRYGPLTVAGKRAALARLHPFCHIEPVCATVLVFQYSSAFCSTFNHVQAFSNSGTVTVGGNENRGDVRRSFCSYSDV